MSKNKNGLNELLISGWSNFKHENELKNCPFCSGGPVIFHAQYPYVFCSNLSCRARGPEQATAEDAKLKWNERI